MNKLETTFNASVRFTWDDLEWMQSALEELIEGLTSAYGDNFILSGCEVTSSEPTQGIDRFTWTAGFAVINKELVKVEAGYLDISQSSSDRANWAIISSYDSSGSKVDSNNNSVDCYEIRRGKLVAEPQGDTYYLSMKTLKKLQNEFGEAVFAAKDDSILFKNPSYANDWGLHTGYPLKYRTNQFGQLEIKGRVNPSSATKSHVLTIALEDRLSKDVSGVAFGESGSMVLYRLFSNGELIIQGYTTGEEYYYINDKFKI